MKKQKIAILGPEFSYTDLAYKRAKRARRAAEKISYFPTISAVFLAVIKGKAFYGLVPLKNTASGIIRESAMNFAKYKEKRPGFSRLKGSGRSLRLIPHHWNPPQDRVMGQIKIHKRFWMKISHVLAVLPNTREQDIDTIMTNRVIFSQCRKFLKKHFPRAQKIFSKTSSAAGEFLAKMKKRGMAVIVSKEAAKHYGLKILRTRIEDSSRNFTEFVIFSMAPP